MEKMGKEHSNFASIGEKTAVIKEAEHIEIGELFIGGPSVMKTILVYPKIAQSFLLKY